MARWCNELTNGFGHNQKTKLKQKIQPCFDRLTCGHATLHNRLNKLGATVRATIGIALTTKESLYNCHMLVDNTTKREKRKLLECCILHTKGLRLYFLQTSNQSFLGEPRVTLGDSIELFAIMTSPSPLKPEELDFMLRTVD